MITVAIDVMGGDAGASGSLSALKIFLEQNYSQDVAVQLFGNERLINQYLSTFNIRKDFVDIFDTQDNIVKNTDKPAHAVRVSKGTSMFEAISSVAEGKADTVVSAGNTGAYMALSKIIIGILDGISRPALVNFIPNINNGIFSKTVMLDLGANIDCSAEKLYQFAVMGNAVANGLLGIKNPKIGLLNIGTEQNKGTTILEEAYELLAEQSCLNFLGFIEGTDISNGKVDVVVTDGFSGNIALKAIEGTVKLVLEMIKESINSHKVAKLGYSICLRGAFRDLKNKIDPANYNGAPFIGLQKPVVKSHGGASPVGFANAIATAVSLVRSNFIDNVKKSISNSKCEKCILT